MVPWIAAAAAVVLPVGAVLYGNHLRQSTPTAIAVSPSPSPSQSPSPTVTPTPTPSASTSPSPSPSPTSAPSSLLVYITQSDYGYLAVQTIAGASCTARATFNDGSDVPGLRNPRVADDQGAAWWWYQQLPTDQDGGMYRVTCTLNGLQGYTEHEFSPPN